MSELNLDTLRVTTLRPGATRTGLVSVSAAHNTWTNASLPIAPGLYVIHAYISSADFRYQGHAFGRNNGAAGLEIPAGDVHNGEFLELQGSGGNLQVRQLSGSTQTVNVTYTRLN